MRDVLAALATSFLVSRKQVVTLGTMRGMQMLSWEEACLASTPVSVVVVVVGGVENEV
jgi:hypothetical protein